MDAALQRELVHCPVARAHLTDHQRMIVDLVTTPTASGKRRSIQGIADGLMVSRQAIYETLRLARANALEARTA